MRIYKEKSKRHKSDYIFVEIEQSEVDGLQGDLEIVLKCDRCLDTPFPAIGWKMKINGREWGDYLPVYVPEDKLNVK